MVNNLKEILEDFIDSKTHIKHQTTWIKLEEPQNTSTKELHSVKITGFQHIYFALKLDEDGYSFLGNLIAGNHKYARKACDAVIFCEVKPPGSPQPKPYIFLIEMKSGTKDGLAQKFKNGNTFVAFLTSMLENHEDISLSDFKVKHILFDRKMTKGKSIQTDIQGIKYYHQGFSNPDNETRIQKFC